MSVQIQIRGRTYTLRSDESEEDLMAVAHYLDSKMDSLSRASFDEYTVAILAALNIASEFYRFRKTVSEELGLIDKEAASISAIVDAAIPEVGT